jgi:type I restriction enzyme, S subunit
MRDDWQRTRLGEVTEQVQQSVKVEEGKKYRLLGVSGKAQGVFGKEAVTSETTKAKSFFRVPSGTFIYNRLFAGNGSFAVVPAELDGSFVSNEFPVFSTDASRLDVTFLGLVFQQPPVWDAVAAQCVGTTGSRMRWKEHLFADFTVLLPPVSEQRRIVDLIEHIDTNLEAARNTERATGHLRAAVREQLLAEVVHRDEFARLATIEARLVDPTEDHYSQLPHIGIDRIESSTGRLDGVQTAAEDGVTSAKFLFGPEDVVYSKIRPELKKACHPAYEGLASADAYPLRPVAGITPAYLLEVLLSREFIRQAVERSGRTKMPKINRRELVVRYGVGLSVGLGEDLVDGLGPDEGDAAVVPAVDEGSDRVGELAYGGERGAADRLSGDDREERLDQVHP